MKKESTFSPKCIAHYIYMSGMVILAPGKPREAFFRTLKKFHWTNKKQAILL